MNELNPALTSRAQSFALFASAPMPMLTVFKTLDVTKAVKKAKRRKVKLNALLCHAVYLAAKDINEMHYLVKDGKTFLFKRVVSRVSRERQRRKTFELRRSRKRKLFCVLFGL